EARARSNWRARGAEITEHERRLTEMPQAAAEPEPAVARDYARDIGAMRCQKAPQPRAAMRNNVRLHPATLRAGVDNEHGLAIAPWVNSVRSSASSVFEPQSFRLRRQPR